MTEEQGKKIEELEKELEELEKELAMLKAKVKLTKRVKAVLAKDFVGTRLEGATKAVSKGLVRNWPELLTDKQDKHDKETFEEIVWDAAEREGY